MPGLTAGIAAADITPPSGLPMAGYGSRDKLAQAVADPLRAQALVLQSGETACAIICADLIGLEAEIVQDIRARAAAASGLQPDHIAVCCSHTHWGPAIKTAQYLMKPLRDAVSPEYRERLVETLARLVADANAARVPAAAGMGSGYAYDISFNRRPVGPDFRTDMRLAMEPALASIACEVGNELALAWEKGEHMGPRLSEPLEEIEGLRLGPADAEVPVLRLDKTEGTPLAAMINFACHAVCGGAGMYDYSSDYIGPAREAFAALTGCPMLFTDGCAGDQVPRWRQNQARERVGRSLGAEAAKTWLGIDERHGDLPLAVAKSDVHLPLNPLIIPLDQAQAALAARPDPESDDAMWERAMLGLATETQGMTEGFPAEIWAMRLGDMGLVMLPGEVLVEIGMQIKQRSPFPVTMVVSLGNGSIGYLSTDNACREGGYEPAWSPIGPGTERVLVETAVKLLEELV